MKLLYLFIFLITAMSSFAATVTDTSKVKIDSSKYYYFTAQDLTTHLNHLEFKNDTSFSGIENYNAVHGSTMLYQDLGFSAQPHQSTFFSVQNNPRFGLGLNSQNLYLINNDNQKYYRTYIPFSQLFWVSGAKKEQNLDAFLTRNFGKGLNVGFDFHIIDATGIYQFQAATTKSFRLFTSYKTKNNRYNAYANYIYNKMLYNQNGGIVSDAMLDSMKTKEIIPVNLQTAKRMQRVSTIALQHYFNIWQSVDSTNTNDKKLNRVIRLGHSIEFTSNSFVYKDALDTTSYYKNNYDKTSTTTYDSTNYGKFENALSLSFLETKGLNIVVTGRHQYVAITQNDSKAEFDNYFAGGEVYNSFNSHLHYGFKGEYGLDGYNKNDYRYAADVKINFTPTTNLSLSAAIQQNQPDFLQYKYISKHFNWVNNFNKIDAKTVGAKLEVFPRTEIGGSIIQLSNYVYYGLDATPTQYTPTAQIYQAYINKQFIFGRFEFITHTWYQKTNRDTVIHLPEIASKNSLLINFALFKKVLKCQVGFDVTYFTSYYANAYMPATGQFYNQNTKKVGDYPYVDVFVNFNLKRANGFLKFQHVNAGLMGTNYYLTPHYPVSDLVFLTGICWRFYK